MQEVIVLIIVGGSIIGLVSWVVIGTFSNDTPANVEEKMQKTEVRFVALITIPAIVFLGALALLYNEVRKFWMLGEIFDRKYPIFQTFRDIIQKRKLIAIVEIEPTYSIKIENREGKEDMAFTAPFNADEPFEEENEEVIEGETYEQEEDEEGNPSFSQDQQQTSFPQDQRKLTDLLAEKNYAAFEDCLHGLIKYIIERKKQVGKVNRDNLVGKDLPYPISRANWDTLLSYPYGWFYQADLLDVEDNKVVLLQENPYPTLVEWINSHLLQEKEAEVLTEEDEDAMIEAS